MHVITTRRRTGRGPARWWGVLGDAVRFTRLMIQLMAWFMVVGAIDAVKWVVRRPRPSEELPPRTVVTEEATPPVA